MSQLEQENECLHESYTAQTQDIWGRFKHDNDSLEARIQELMLAQARHSPPYRGYEESLTQNCSEVRVSHNDLEGERSKYVHTSEISQGIDLQDKLERERTQNAQLKERIFEEKNKNVTLKRTLRDVERDLEVQVDRAVQLTSTQTYMRRGLDRLSSQLTHQTRRAEGLLEVRVRLEAENQELQQRIEIWDHTYKVKGLRLVKQTSDMMRG
ncbi:hypothetical protein F5Y15DRAFT_416657 [Xylariaceae sp. FL0016]|nr:hypothetical protein F5Y15DRAFT_416657 [Xylariaceae sp. FL0016]